MQSFSNLDARPLPEGWYQHYDPSRRAWYYVQTSVHPPKHSFVHPLDMMGNTSRPVAMPQVTAELSSSSIAPPRLKLSAAQMLYASAGQHGVSLVEKDLPSTYPPTRGSPSAVYPFQSLQPRQQSMYTQAQVSPLGTAYHPDNHRASTFPVGNTYPPPVRKEVPHLVTTAKAPSLLFSSQNPVELNAPGLLLSNQTPVQLAAPSPSRPLGEENILPAIQRSPTSPAGPAYYVPSTNALSHVSPTLPNQTSGSRTSESDKRISSALMGVGKKIGIAAAKLVASSVSTALLGPDVSSSLSDLLSGVLDAPGLQAVLQGQPNADYASAIAALQQQQAVQASPTVDYQALISQMQQLQLVAMQQQQQFLTMQANATAQQQATSLTSGLAQNQAAVSLPTTPNASSLYSLGQQQGSNLSPILTGNLPSLTSQNLPSSPQGSRPHTQPFNIAIGQTPLPPQQLESPAQATELPPTYNQMLQNQLLTSQQTANQHFQQQLQLQQQSNAVAQAAFTAQMHQNQALINSFSPTSAPAPAHAHSHGHNNLFTDLMTSFLSTQAGTTTDTSTGSTDYSQLLSSLGSSDPSQSLGLSELTSSVGGLDFGSVLSGTSSDQ